MRSNLYQGALILLGVVATIFFGIFFMREIFPEYKIYQEDYVALEKFRSTYTHEPPPAFQIGVKQLVFEREDKGNPAIDRCTSCHVAVQLPHFSPTKIAHDINGNILVDDQGHPVQIHNENYVWARLDQRIAELTDAKVNENLRQQGEDSKVRSRLQEAEELKALKTAKVGDITYDVSKVLVMHPLMGRETRPFEYHPIEEYGCTSCHNGNGRGLTTEKAHGPVFDGHYEKEYFPNYPQFNEIDPENDPKFAHVFNEKPGDSLLFQTTPIYIGSLIQAKCVQCHQSSSKALESISLTTSEVAARREGQTNAIQKGFNNDKDALVKLSEVRYSIKTNGLQPTIDALTKESLDFTLTPARLDQVSSQLAFIKSATNISGKSPEDQQKASQEVLGKIDSTLVMLLGSPALAEALEKDLAGPLKDHNKGIELALDKFLSNHWKDPKATGSIFAKMTALDLEKQMIAHVQDINTSFEQAATDQKTMSALASDIDLLTYNYHRGQQLFISQACYACHRIAGFARGGVGPELTREGKSYPWFVKESIYWPQADLATSTMPNYRMDHEELEDLVTFLMGQVGETNAVSSTAYKTAIQDWEAGRKLPWEKPVTPAQMKDLRFSMTVFATQGCAACHRLKGFESDVGFAAEKEAKGKPSFDTMYSESEWFKGLFPEAIVGTDIIKAIEDHSAEIDKHIVDDVRQGSILEQIEDEFPKTIESFYTHFKFADRAKNAYYNKLADAETDPKKKQKILNELRQWHDRVHRVLMVYIQEYGLGRIIGPRPNWSGVYRSDEWLMEHFHNPQSHIARSIMPVLPFDDSKFYALTHMLDVLGIRNRDAVRAIWDNRGFNPQLAYEIHCSQCHGPFLHGNGPVAEWIYPIPKNLRNGDFLRNLTKERAVQSITHGVHGTPMPPWGEVATDKPTADGIPVLTHEEILKLVEWLFAGAPGGTVIKGFEDVPKWNYTPEDVIKELHQEGNVLPRVQPGEEPQIEPLKENSAAPHAMNQESRLAPELAALPAGEGLWAALDPAISIAATVLPADKDAKDPTILKLFDAVPNPVPGTEKYAYYIKKEYYTPENIEAGRQFFELNCAVCHGREGDGAGIRAGAMTDAKPRMLTNLDWVQSRDDLRLLRSIKYGVPGTAMTPWGDLTSSLQRLQLVIFIRTLTEDKGLREELMAALYKAFDQADTAIEFTRAAEYPELARIQDQYNAVRDERERLYDKTKEGSTATQLVVDVYQKEVNLLAQLKQRQDVDDTILKLKKSVKEERDIYQNVGLNVIQRAEPRDLHTYVKMVGLLDGRFILSDGKLAYSFDEEKEKQMRAYGDQVVADVDKTLKELNEEKNVLDGQIPSAQRAEKLTTLNAQIDGYGKLKRLLISGMEQGQRVRKQEKELFDRYQAQLKAVNKVEEKK